VLAPKAVRAQLFPGTLPTPSSQPGTLQWYSLQLPSSYVDTAGAWPRDCFSSRPLPLSLCSLQMVLSPFQDSHHPLSPLPRPCSLLLPPTQTVAYLENADSSVGPCPGFCHMWPLSNRNRSLGQVNRDSASVSHSPAAAERVLGGGASVMYSTFLPASQRAAWEIQWGCPLTA
jgi:hypothetical protein